jgi:hypothetical protein
MQACSPLLNGISARHVVSQTRAAGTFCASLKVPVTANLSRSVPKALARSAQTRLVSKPSTMSGTSTGPPTASKTVNDDTDDQVLCRSVEEKRTPLINLEGGRQISYVKCSCSKCGGLVMCGDKQLLPTAVTPNHYDLHLTPDLVTLQYTGVMTVLLTVHEPSDAVTFHARDLKIQSGVVVDKDGAERTNPGGPDVLYGTETQETATVALSKPFTEKDVGSVVELTLKFTGELNDKLAGFYRRCVSRVSQIQAHCLMPLFDCLLFTLGHVPVLATAAYITSRLFAHTVHPYSRLKTYPFRVTTEARTPPQTTRRKRGTSR